MRPIEIQNGYMVCVTCRGFIEAGNMSPCCECFEEDAFSTDIEKPLN